MNLSKETVINSLLNWRFGKKTDFFDCQ